MYRSVVEYAKYAIPVALALVTALGATLLVPWALGRVPADYFVRPRRSGGSVGRWIVGVGLLLAGLAMLVLPGPGIVAIVLGLVVLDLPLLRRALLRALRAPRIRQSVERIRERRGKPPLELP